MIYTTLSVNPAKFSWNNGLDACQEWSDATFDDEYRQALLTLLEGLATLTGYLVGFAYSWLLLQCAKTARSWLSEVCKLCQCKAAGGAPRSSRLKPRSIQKSAGKGFRLLFQRPSSTTSWRGPGPLNRWNRHKNNAWR